jgi:hypothetical protein
MAHPEHLEVLRRGVSTWNRWYREHYWNSTPDLSYADLSDMDLSDIKLHFVRLTGASFRGSNLQRASFVKSLLNHVDLSHTNLRGANFREASLVGADLSYANLEEGRLDRAKLLDAKLHRTHLNAAKIRDASLVRANLCEASLRWTDLVSAYLNSPDLRSADLSFARIGKNTWVNIDFRAVGGLETVVHTAPAFRVDMRTFFHSWGHCPEPFLREMGFSEHDLITLQSIDSRCMAFPTCLLSYASEDHAFAEQLLGDLRARGVFCQAEPYERTSGKLIKIHDKLLLIISTASSSWRNSEVSCILKEARAKAYWEAPSWEASSILCPIGLDKTFQAKVAGWPSSYRQAMSPYYNFSGWRDRGHYEQTLGRFLEGLAMKSA